MGTNTTPTITITSNNTALKAGDSATITFTLSEPSTDFVQSDITVTGGALSNFTGSGTAYTATYTPTPNSEVLTEVRVGSGVFSDSSGNKNADGSDEDNAVFFKLERNYTVAEGTVATGKLPPGTAATSQGDFGFIGPDGSRLLSGVADLLSISPDGTFSASWGSDFNGFFSYQTTAGDVFVTWTPTPDRVSLIVAEPSLLLSPPSVGASRRIIEQSDGKLVLAGYTQESPGLQLFRILADGGIDRSYGDQGYINHNGLLMYDAVIQVDNKIVVGGVSSSGGQNQVVRIDVSGALDPTFGGDGRVSVPWSANNAIVQAVELDAVGRILAVGRAFPDSNASTFDFGVARLNLDGSLDTSFDGDGWSRIDFGGSSEWARGVAIQPDGKLVVGGQTNLKGTSDFALLRLNSNGSLDTSFGQSGIKVVELSTSQDTDYGGVTRLADGDFVLTGTAQTLTQPNGYSQGRGLVVRINVDGSLDTAFGTGGIVYLDFPTLPSPAHVLAYDATQRPDGKILVPGNISFDGYAQYAFTALLNPNGSLDTSFGTNGVVVEPLGQSIGSLLSRDGGFIFGGYTSTENALSYPAKLKLLPNGQPDSSFNPVPRFKPGGPAIALNHLVSVYDKDADAQMVGPNASYNGLIVTLQRTAERGGPSSDDRFGALGALQLLDTVAGAADEGDIVVSGTDIGNYTQIGGWLELRFLGNISQSLVDRALSSLTYANIGSTAPQQLGIQVTASDGGSSDIAVLTLFLSSVSQPSDNLDLEAPTISITSDLTSLKAGQAATVTFTLSEPSTDFTASDVSVSGGTLSNFQGSGTTYSAVYVPSTNSDSWTSVRVATGAFSDIAGNLNQDGTDANNVINFLLERVFTVSEGKTMSGKLPAGSTVQPNPDWFTFAYLNKDGSTAEEQKWYLPINPDGSFSVEGLGDKNGLLYAQTTAGLVKVFITPTPDPLRVITSSSGTFTGAPSRLLTGDREIVELTDGSYVGIGQLQSLTDATLWASYRLTEGGKLDINYGNHGYADYENLYVFDTATQADNKLLVTGSLPRGAILRLNENGSVDSTFGSSGFAYAPSWGSNNGNNSWFQGVVVQPDGRIVAVGRALNTNWDFGVVRYLPTGQLDTTFDFDGWRTTDLGGTEDRSRAVLIQPDGKIAVAGFTNRRGDVDFAMLRLNADGSLDMSFGDSGISIVNRPSTDDYMYRALECLRSGAFVLAGNSMTSPTAGKALAMRLDSTGRLDPTFGTNGAVVFDIPGIAETSATIWRVTELIDGRLIFAGTADFSAAEISSYKSQSFVVRLLPNGELDQSFGTGGYALSPFSSQSLNQTGLIDSKGRYLMGGSKTDPVDGWSVPVVSRLLPNGQTDLSFNPTPTFQPGGPAVALNHLVSIYDADASPWEIGPSASYAGTTVTIQRQGAASVDDRFGALGSLQLQRSSAAGSSDAGTVNLEGLAIGSYEQVGGKLTLTFNVSADQTKVDAALSSLSYANTGSSAPAKLQLLVTAKDPQGSSDEAIIDLDLGKHALGVELLFWRSGVPMTGATVFSVGTGQLATSQNTVTLKNAALDASNNLRFELWAEPLKQAASAVDLSLIKPANWLDGFVPTTPSGWVLQTDQAVGGEYRYAAADLSWPRVNTKDVSFHLGTYMQPTNALNASTGDLSIAWSLSQSDKLASPFQQKDLAIRKANVNATGVATMSGLLTDTYQVLASRSTTDIGRAITAGDALAALMIAVGLNPNGADMPVTIAQFAAADVDRSGVVTSVDALNVLKMAVGLSTAPAPTWLWVTEAAATMAVSPTYAHDWSKATMMSVPSSEHIKLVGVLQGDVNGSWTPPPKD